jgi:hypothetical protein
MSNRSGLPCAPTSRFWCKVRVRASGCWQWAAGKSKDGYGRITLGRRTTGAHRVSWQIAYGDIPNGKHVLHKCDNPACVRPDHLFLGTHADNMADCAAKGRIVAFKGLAVPKKKCRRGHEFTPENTYVNPSGRRLCRCCDNARRRRRYRQNNEQECARKRRAYWRDKASLERRRSA